MRLALFEPDIPQNAGTLFRLGACLEIPVDLIEPCGFVFSERRMRRAALDYLAHVDLTRHSSWKTYQEWRRLNATGAKGNGRLVLLTSKGDMNYADFSFRPDDTLMVGRESAGVPDSVSSAADARIRIPMAKGLRSINVAQAAAMVLGEALRQTNGFPQ